MVDAVVSGDGNEIGVDKKARELRMFGCWKELLAVIRDEIPRPHASILNSLGAHFRAELCDLSGF